MLSEPRYHKRNPLLVIVNGVKQSRDCHVVPKISGTPRNDNIKRTPANTYHKAIVAIQPKKSVKEEYE